MRSGSFSRGGGSGDGEGVNHSIGLELSRSSEHHIIREGGRERESERVYFGWFRVAPVSLSAGLSRHCLDEDDHTVRGH